MIEASSAQDANHLPDEAKIVEAAKIDDQAFETLYNFYLPKIYGFLYKRTGNQTVAEDLTSETFLKVFCNLKKYHYQGCYFSAWLYRVATNNLIDYYRKNGRKKEVALLNAENVVSDQPVYSDSNQDPHERRNINIAMQKMPARYARVIYLKFFGELSLPEIAATLQISPNNARVLIHRALNNFKKNYKKV